MPPKQCSTRRKVKSGCRTCKTRKVKCDEIKPVCARCRSTGRVCEGYGIWGGGGNTYFERYGSTRKSSPKLPAFNPPPTKRFSEEEGKHLQWFNCHVIHEVLGLFDTKLWTTLVLPAMWNEPAILHAVIALSSAHKSNRSQECKIDDDDKEEFTLSQYTKAIRHLQPLLANKTKSNTSTLIILLTSLLFTFLEYLRGNSSTAALHLHIGLRLLRQSYLSSGILYHGVLLVSHNSTQRNSPDQGLLQAFATLHVQADLFGMHIPDVALLLQPLEVEMPTPRFSSATEARDALVKVLHGIILISQRGRTMIGRADRVSSPSLLAAQGAATKLLDVWLEVYHETTSDTAYRVDGHEEAYAILLNYHTMSSIMCQTLFCASNSSYAAFELEFEDIVQRAERLLRESHNPTPSTYSSATRPTSVVSVGWIPPLYFTALKSCTRGIKQRAIVLLRCMARKEGVWDSSVAADVAERMMQYEDGWYYAGTTEYVNQEV